MRLDHDEADAVRPEHGLAVAASTEQLRSWLPQLESVVALTVSAAVTMSETGRYDRPSLAGEPWEDDSRRIALRVDPSLLGPLVTSTGESSLDPDALQVVGRADALLHRGFVSTTADRELLRSLTQTAGVAWHPRETRPQRPVRQTRGAERAALADAGTMQHVDSVLSDAGRRRGQVLPGCGRDVTSPAHPADVLHALVHVGELGIPFTMAAPTPGLMQLRTGRLATMRQTHSGTVLGMGGCTVSVDPHVLGPAWITRPSDGPAIVELYDVWGRCVLLLLSAAHHGTDDAIRWEHLTAMLSLGH